MQSAVDRGVRGVVVAMRAAPLGDDGLPGEVGQNAQVVAGESAVRDQRVRCEQRVCDRVVGFAVVDADYHLIAGGRLATSP
jgi:hypothetical protein